MAIPILTPRSNTSEIILKSTGSISEVADLPFGIYSEGSSPLYSADFISGAVDQVSFVFKRLGGDVLDIEIANTQVYAAYEEATLEYSYLINIHQSKSIMSDVLGNQTGTFDHDGNLKSGPLSSSLDGTHVALKYPRFEFSYARRVAEGIGGEANVGGYLTTYSASFATVAAQQDYDLQEIVQALDDDGGQLFNNKINNQRIHIHKVLYKTPHAMWRFYGYYGGLNTVGNLSAYGQYADDSTFEIIPTWQNKAQAMTFEDAIWTRNSHYSYELHNNKLRLFPAPVTTSPKNIWFHFSVTEDKSAWENHDTDRKMGMDGINNMNTVPLGNVPFGNINSIGKQWIRRFALALSKEMLGQVRSKFATIPIPGESVTLNGTALITEGKQEQEKLREELKTVLDELIYRKLMEEDAANLEATVKIMQQIPVPIFVG